MPNILFIILISFLTLCISFVSVKGTLTDLKYTKKWWKVITQRGWIAVLLTFAIIGLLIWQTILSEKRGNKKDVELKKEREKSDSVISSRVDSSRKILFNDLSEALAKQDLELDTVTKKLENLKDSVQKKITIFESEDPLLDFCSDGIVLEYQTKDTCLFIVKICSQNAASRNVSLSLSILSSTKKDKGIFDDLKLLSASQSYLSKNLVIKKDGSKQQGILVYEKDINTKKSFIFFIYGTYANSTTKEQYEINTIGIYYIDTKIFGFVSSPYDDRIRNFLKNKNL